MDEEVRESLAEGMSDAEAGVLLALSHQLVGEALARGRAHACFHRLRLSAVRLAGRRTRRVALRLTGPHQFLAQTIVTIDRPSRH